MRRIERSLFGALLGLSLAACADGITPPEATPAQFIQGGTFTMGGSDRDPCNGATANAPECDPLVQSELIQHTATVSDFCIDTTEVTVEQYRHCVERGACKKAEITNVGRNGESNYVRRYYNEPDTYGDHPVVGVSHERAVEYCQFRGGRLPTEVEWEFAATSRGERPERVYGPELNLDKQINGVESTNCQGRNGQIALGLCSAGVLPVGQAEADITAQGVRDMAGNVAEWVADEFNFIAYCADQSGYTVQRSGGGQPNNIVFSNGRPAALEQKLNGAEVTKCHEDYVTCEQICSASFSLPKNIDCNASPTPHECRYDTQRREYQRRSCQHVAREAEATVPNVVGLDFECDPSDTSWCDGDPAVCAAYCTCLNQDPPDADFTGGACVTTCVDDYAQCIEENALKSASQPVAMICNFEGKKPTPWCAPRTNANSTTPVSDVPSGLAYRAGGEKNYVVRGGSVADQLACFGRPTRRNVQNAPHSLVGFRCAYDTSAPVCQKP